MIVPRTDSAPDGRGHGGSRSYCWQYDGRTEAARRLVLFGPFNKGPTSNKNGLNPWVTVLASMRHTMDILRSDKVFT